MVRTTPQHGISLRRLGALVVACAVSVALGAEPLPGDRPEPITDPDVGAIMSGLRSGDYHQRERASIDLQSMIEKQRLSERDVLELAARTDITPEQRLRLLDKAKVAFISSKRAAMGVGFAEVPGYGAQLTQVFDKFPCYGVLRPGDVVESIGGVSMAARDNRSRLDLDLRLRSSIISHDPGESVTVVLRRSPDSTPAGLPEKAEARPNQAGAEILKRDEMESWPVLEVQVELGPFDGLIDARPIDARQMDAAWMLRVSRVIGVDHAGWPSVTLAGLVGSPLAIEQVPAPLRDNQISGAADRVALRDRVFTAQRNQINAQARLQMQFRVQRQQQLEAQQEGDAPGKSAGVQLRDQSGRVSIEALADLDTELREIERQIGQAANDGAAAEILEELRRRHEELTAQMRALAGVSR